MRIILTTILLLILPTLVIADEYYIGQWEWNTDNQDRPYWIAPHADKLTGVIDMRSIPEQTQAGGIPEGYAIFTYSEVINDPSLIHFGSNKDSVLNLKAIEEIKGKLKVDVKSTNVKDVIYEVLTKGGDPTGQTSFKPLMPTNDLKMQINIGREGKIKELTLIPYVSKEWDLVLKTMQNDYKEMLKSVDYTVIAKVLDYWEEQFGVNYEKFIPDDSIKIASLPHQTTVTEDFNCADNSSLTCDLTWTETTGCCSASGDIQIVSNEAYQTFANSWKINRHGTDLSTSNNYAQADTTYIKDGTDNDFASFIWTRSSSDQNGYYAIRERTSAGSGDSGYEIRKRVSGTETVIVAKALQAFSFPETWKIEANGSAIKSYLAGVEKQSVTDTSVSTGLRGCVAIYTQINGGSVDRVTMDNFENGDIAAATSPSISGTRFSGVRISGM